MVTEMQCYKSKFYLTCGYKYLYILNLAHAHTCIFKKNSGNIFLTPLCLVFIGSLNLFSYCLLSNRHVYLSSSHTIKIEGQYNILAGSRRRICILRKIFVETANLLKNQISFRENNSTI